MNLRNYYENVKKIREGLSGQYVYLTSLATPNGGKEGCVSEVPVEVAARMIADGVARKSEVDEILGYQLEAESLRAAAQEDQLRNRLRITLVNEPDIQLAGDKSPAKPTIRS
ncbi:MAG: hypothetical protein KIT83_05435 [Bryobacterales bacterium]|nr:hypothetical protein [Bryobacterales bacterium]